MSSHGAAQEAARQHWDRRIAAYLDFMATIRSVSRVARDVLRILPVPTVVLVGRCLGEVAW